MQTPEMQRKVPDAGFLALGKTGGERCTEGGDEMVGVGAELEEKDGCSSPSWWNEIEMVVDGREMGAHAARSHHRE